MPFNDIITYEAVGVDGVTYRVTAGSDPVTRGQGGAPTGSERSFDVQAISGRGNYYAASFLFFQYALARHACDPWGNPIAENGVELTEEQDGCGKIWRGHIRWEFPSANAAVGNDVAYTTDGGEGSEGEITPFSYAPFISSFSTAGGTRHTNVSFGTRRYPINGAAPDFKGGIGWNGEEFEGVDVVSPTVTFEVTARTPAALVMNFGDFLSQTVPYVGCVNNAPFYGCSAGTILFNGVTSGTLRTRKTNAGTIDPYWEMSYSFAASPNISFDVDGVTVDKYGWEYLWALADETGVIQAVYVEQVYQYANLAQLGFGG